MKLTDPDLIRSATSEWTHARDEFGQQRIRDGVYTSDGVDRPFSQVMERGYEQWQAQRR